MKKLFLFTIYFLLIVSFWGCASTKEYGSMVTESNQSEVLQSNTGTNVAVDLTQNTNTISVNTEINKETVENLEQFDETSVNFNIEDTVKEEEVHETTVQLTDVELYKNFLDSYNVEIVSSPKQISKNKKFASAFSIKCTQDGNPAVNVVVTVKYPVEQINGNVVFGQTNIETDENGIASFNPSNTNFSCNSNVYFFLTPETEDAETLEYAEKNAISIPYQVITNRFWDSGVLALIDYNASNRSLSTNTTATALQPPLRKAGFQTIGNAPFDASIITGQNLYKEAKAIFGSTVSFMIYGTVKYAEPVEKLENGEYIVTFVTDFSVMNLRDGKIVYHEEFLTTETGASEWEATNNLRTKIIPEIITEKVIYGI